MTSANNYGFNIGYLSTISKGVIVEEAILIMNNIGNDIHNLVSEILPKRTGMLYYILMCLDVCLRILRF